MSELEAKIQKLFNFIDSLNKLSANDWISICEFCADMEIDLEIIKGHSEQ